MRWYQGAAILGSSLAAALVAIGIAVHVNAESDRKWCSVVVTIDGAYHQQPPKTEAGKNLAEDMAALRRELHCP